MRVTIVRALGFAAAFVVTGALAAGPARISVNSPSVMEGDGPGSATLDFTLTRSGETGSTVTLGYQVDDNTAIAPGDYVAIPPSTLTFVPGQTQFTVPVTINGDAVIEGDESLFLRLTGIVSVQGATASYADASTFSAGGSSASVAATDLDGDGRTDLAVANAGSDRVSVLLNTTVPGSGVMTYAAASDFAAGNSPRSVIATDLDGDGRLDLAVANADGDSVSVLLNTTEPGSGVITYAPASNFAAGNSPRAVTAADFDGDGRPDLAVANADGNSVSVLLNTTEPGSGVVTYAAAADFATGSSPRALTAADVDGDGRVDLAVANAVGDSVSVLLNTTAPGAIVAAFAGAGDVAAGNGAVAVAAADVDGDGRPDLAVANGNGVAVLLNRPAVLDVSQGTGTLENDDANLTPDPFQFVDQAGVERDTDITSAPVTITGITAAVRIEVSGGRYSVGCTGSFRTSSSTITDGKTVCVRHTSSNSFGSATDTLLTVGGVSDTFTSTTEPDDTTPDAFKFTDVNNVLLNSAQVSNSVAIRGTRGTAPISVVGGEYSVGCTAAFTSAAGAIASGATVCVRHTSSAIHGTATHTTLTVGGVSDIFTSTTPAEQDYSKTGALAPLDALLLLLAAFGGARRRRTKKIRSRGCPCERIP